MNKLRKQWIVALVSGTAAFLLVGCVSRPVAPYAASYANVTRLKAAVTTPVVVEPFSGGPDHISIRGSTATSPVGKDFAAYVQGALTAELEKAQMLAQNSAFHIQGVVIETDVAAGGVSEASATITAEFVVTKGGVERYRKQLSARHSWESSFVGAIAIPRAFESYPKVVEALLLQLYGDANFSKSLK